MKVITNSPEETKELGKKIGKYLGSGDVVSLVGDLGAGKTHLVKGIALGLGVKDEVNSPSYTLIHEYGGRVPLYHFDVYRLEELWQMEDLGYEEYFFGDGVCVIEWGDKISELLPSSYLRISIARPKTESSGKRVIILSGIGKRYKEIVERMSAHGIVSN